jgi:hypothetical protein
MIPSPSILSHPLYLYNHLTTTVLHFTNSRTVHIQVHSLFGIETFKIVWSKSELSFDLLKGLSHEIDFKNVDKILQN